jgi:hypothetical protein
MSNGFDDLEVIRSPAQSLKGSSEAETVTGTDAKAVRQLVTLYHRA